MDSSRLTITKNYVDGNVSETTITAEKNSGFKSKSTDLWPLQGYFKHQRGDEFSLQKANIPEMTLLYVNQASLRHKNDVKLYYWQHFILGQIIPLAKSPSDLSSYELKKNEVKILRQKYDLSSRQFLGLVETLGCLVVRGDRNECFFDYGYNKNNTKVLYSTSKMKIPNSFDASLFTKHKQRYENGELSKDFSRLYYFLPSATNRSENINQYLGQVFLRSIDIEEPEFWEGFNPSMLDSDCPERERALEKLFWKFSKR